MRATAQHYLRLAGPTPQSRYRGGVSASHGEAAEPRAMRIEVFVMLAMTFGVSAFVAVLKFGDALLSGLGGYRVRMNRDQSRYDLINLGLNLVSVGQLVAWGGLALYLLWRTGIGPAAIGLGRLSRRSDILGGVALAALIGIPGLLLVCAGALLCLPLCLPALRRSGDVRGTIMTLSGIAATTLFMLTLFLAVAPFALPLGAVALCMRLCVGVCRAAFVKVAIASNLACSWARANALARLSSSERDRALSGPFRRSLRLTSCTRL